MMSEVDLQAIANINNVTFSGKNFQINNIKIDSREIESGDVFIALKGKNFDGHDFVKSAKEKGAIAAVVEMHQSVNITQIVVKNTLDALGNIAKINCRAFNGKVAAITGSSGKTTCKNMLASILSVVGSVCCTKGNFNNEIGLPLTVQELNESHDFAVIEMGATKIGDIDYLAKIANPDVCAITNISEAHIESFGTLENTAKTKGEIFNYLGSTGWAVINKDDSFFDFWLKKLNKISEENRLVTFSIENKKANIFATNISLTKRGISFDVNINFKNEVSKFRINLNLLGFHNIQNSLLAISMAKALGISNKDISKGLSDVRPEKGRLSLSEIKKDVFLIDDSYNANPKSMHSAIDTLSSFAILNSLDSILVIGDMAELGKDSADAHYQIGKYAATKKIKKIFVIGDFSEYVINGFKENGDGFSEVFSEKKDIEKKLLHMSLLRSVILIKGSRRSNMDELSLFLINLEK